MENGTEAATELKPEEYESATGALAKAQIGKKGGPKPKVKTPEELKKLEEQKELREANAKVQTALRSYKKALDATQEYSEGMNSSIENLISEKGYPPAMGTFWKAALGKVTSAVKTGRKEYGHQITKMDEKDSSKKSKVVERATSIDDLTEKIKTAKSTFDTDHGKDIKRFSS